MQTTVFIDRDYVTDLQARRMSGGAVEKVAALLEGAAHRTALTELERFPVGSRVRGVGVDGAVEVVDHVPHVGPLAPYLSVRGANGTARLLPVVDAYLVGGAPPTTEVALPITVDIEPDRAGPPAGALLSAAELVGLAAHCRDVAHALLVEHVRARYPLGSAVHLSVGDPAAPRPVLYVVGHRVSGPYSPALLVEGDQGRQIVQPCEVEPAPEETPGV